MKAKTDKRWQEVTRKINLQGCSARIVQFSAKIYEANRRQLGNWRFGYKMPYLSSSHLDSYHDERSVDKSNFLNFEIYE